VSPQIPDRTEEDEPAGVWDLPKIREVDEILIGNAAAQRSVIEVHPEVSFAEWGKRPLKHSKKSAAGKSERQAFAPSGVNLVDLSRQLQPRCDCA
jgi:predicted RNase H-like nuclease